MRYEYECDVCGVVTLAFRDVDRRHVAPECCVCGGKTRKIVSRPALVLQRMHERDEWRDGLSREDRLKQMKADEARMDAQFEGGGGMEWLTEGADDDGGEE